MEPHGLTPVVPGNPPSLFELRRGPSYAEAKLSGDISPKQKTFCRIHPRLHSRGLLRRRIKLNRGNTVNEPRHTILIVDDDQEIIDLLRDHFRKRNCESIATADPLTVVEKLRSFAVKLILLDLKMRKLDGFEVLDKIKQAGLELPPTLIITGFLPKYQDRLKEYCIYLY